METPFGIPYGCIVSPEVDNLLFAGRCISADTMALGSLRIIPTCMALGQAAGVGACVAIEDQVIPAEADVSKIRAALIEQKAILGPVG